jgi:hypothetical protein
MMQWLAPTTGIVNVSLWLSFPVQTRFPACPQCGENRTYEPVMADLPLIAGAPANLGLNAVPPRLAG